MAMNIPHGMPCPVCNVPLVMSERHNVEIDYCPQCRGVWLDRGELDKIIERAGPNTAPAPQVAPRGTINPFAGPDQSYGHGYPGKPYKRKKSFLEELFD